MVERRELITICRQIGTMMEVGVDFLRITRALREQTENPRLLELYDQIESDLKAGDSLSEAISHAPDIFSPFAVSLLQQGEVRGELESAWERIADFLKQEAQEDQLLGEGGGDFVGAGYIPTRGLPSHNLSVVAPRAPVTIGLVSDLLERLQDLALRGLTWISALLLSLATVWGAVALGYLELRYVTGVQLCVAAVFLGGASIWLRRKVENDRRLTPQCSFCGKDEGDTLNLQRSPLLAGAAICAECATQIAGYEMATHPARPTISADDLEHVIPGENNAPSEDVPVPDEKRISIDPPTKSNYDPFGS